ncbi:arsenate reductase (glutaredoxin) [Rhodovulum adriaticum]|uniref:Arsenate reductase n=1 Tax=Rhodovulum adriaticum TaxID=35804 RepID=A0A4R2NI05_RHOAD|nr:arsenate reductase (glutaredoxin) [Rhodovulum adriaticum]MBK1635807.1 arsenate reductase (glutaredoxin) [Rhodovulum adriaticum]TCP21027.1 arsenate reductase [Rhodovulum adriaticum]
MTGVVIWHNPRCSKSRAALALIEGRGISPTVRRYLDDAPSLAELTAARDTLGLRAIDMMRPKEKLFRELGLSKDDDEDRLLAAMADHPKLIERAIVFANGRAVLARPPERVLEIL